jgi:MFS family permease
MRELPRSTAEAGALIASVYLVGEMTGALVRKRLFVLTLLLYLIGTGLAAFVTGHHTGWLVFFYATGVLAGIGIGGQYSAR